MSQVVLAVRVFVDNDGEEDQEREVSDEAKHLFVFGKKILGCLIPAQCRDTQARRDRNTREKGAGRGHGAQIIQATPVHSSRACRTDCGSMSRPGLDRLALPHAATHASGESKLVRASVVQERQGTIPVLLGIDLFHFVPVALFRTLCRRWWGQRAAVRER